MQKTRARIIQFVRSAVANLVPSRSENQTRVTVDRTSVDFRVMV